MSACPSCGSANHPGAQFCAVCGTGLAGDQAPLVQTVASRAQKPVPWLAYGAGFVALAVGSFFVTRLVTKEDSTGTATSPTETVAATDVPATDPGGSVLVVPPTDSTTPVIDTVPATTPVTTPETAPVTTPPDPLAQLAANRDADRPAVESLVGFWVPQLSAKREGIEDDGIIYTNADIVNNHANLVNEFGTLLLFSGDYNYKTTDLWVDIVPIPFNTPDEALVFCTDHGIDRDNCFAKFITHDPNVSPTTKLQP
jgi:serine/threonine-protein kinase